MHVFIKEVAIQLYETKVGIHNTENNLHLLLISPLICHQHVHHNNNININR